LKYIISMGVVAPKHPLVPESPLAMDDTADA